MASVNTKGNLFKSAKVIWFVIAVLLVGVFIGVLNILQNVYQTETYYVLNQDVPTRTQITMNMLVPVVTSFGTAPGGTPDMTQTQREGERSAILSAVQSGRAYSQFPLVAGDVLSPSNVGALSDISVGVPDTWVVTSFAVDYNNAVQGRIQRGTYFDVMMGSDAGAYYPFVNVLTLETATGSAQSSAGATNNSGMNAATSVYTVSMSPLNAGKLQWLSQYGAGQMKLVLSPRQNEYASPRLLDYEGLFYYDQLEDGVIAPGLMPVLDENGEPVLFDGEPLYREITDYTFSDIERDPFGRPISQIENVGLGNAKIPAASAGGQNPVDVNAADKATREECLADGGTWNGGECQTAGVTPAPTPGEEQLEPEDDATEPENNTLP